MLDRSLQRLATRVLPEKCQGGFLSGVARCNRQHEGRVLILARTKTAPIHAQKDVSCCGTNPFVPVNERMIRYQMKKVCGGHRRQPIVQVLTAEAGFRHCQGGLEKSEVADPGRSSVAADHLRMNRDDLIEAEEERRHVITRQAV